MTITKTNSYTFTIEGQPVPKSRPRFGKGRAYTPVKTAAAEKAIAWEIKKQIKTPLGGNISVEMNFFVKGNRRGDLDNLIKLILDASNKIAFKDDKQVVAIIACLRETDKPETIFIITEV